MKSFIPVCVCLVAQACPILWDTMQCSPPGSSVHGNSPGGNSPGKSSEWVTMPSFRGSSQPRDWTQGSYIANRSREAPSKYGTSHEFLCHYYQFSSVQFICSVASDSLRPHGLKHIRLPITNSWSLFKCMSIESLMPPHPLSPTFPPAFNLSQQQGLFQWVSSSHQVAKVLDHGKIVQAQNSTRPGQNSTERIWPCIARPHAFSLFKSIFCYNHKFIAIQSLIQVQLFATPWTAACQASPSFTISWSLLKLMSIKSMVLSNHLFLCRPFSSCPHLSQHQGLF